MVTAGSPWGRTLPRFTLLYLRNIAPSCRPSILRGGEGDRAGPRTGEGHAESRWRAGRGRLSRLQRLARRPLGDVGGSRRRDGPGARASALAAWAERLWYGVLQRRRPEHDGQPAQLP